MDNPKSIQRHHSFLMLNNENMMGISLSITGKFGRITQSIIGKF